MKKKSSLLILISICILSSCNKETVTQNNDGIESNSENNKNLFGLQTENDISFLNSKMSEAQSKYMASLPKFDIIKLKTILQKDHSEISKSTASTWAIGTNNLIWKWDGSSWYQPNSAARAIKVEVGKNGSVWAITNDHKVWKWDGSSWYQPNSAAGLYDITVLSNNIAIGEGDKGMLWITQNGGLSWDQFTSITGVTQLSTGNYGTNFLWVIAYVNNNPQLKYFDINTNQYVTLGGVPNYYNSNGTWVARPAIYNQTFKYIAADPVSGDQKCYLIENVTGLGRIYYAQGNPTNSMKIFEPNVNAKGIRPSSNGNLWVIGGNGTPFISTDNGASWNYANVNANGLLSISSGWE